MSNFDSHGSDFIAYLQIQPTNRYTEIWLQNELWNIDIPNVICQNYSQINDANDFCKDDGNISN